VGKDYRLASSSVTKKKKKYGTGTLPDQMKEVIFLQSLYIMSMNYTQLPELLSIPTFLQIFKLTVREINKQVFICFLNRTKSVQYSRCTMTRQCSRVRRCLMLSKTKST
jgi:hypothetical protein